jgi:hypothetical protein
VIVEDAEPASGASRIDPSGSRDEVTFFGPHEQRMFGCLHMPPSIGPVGVVVCSPIQSEFLANYRREVVLGRALAAAGFPVLRFHYRGTGNSDGDDRHVTIGSMVDDAEAAVGYLRTRTGVTRVAFVGTRLAALVAAGAAGDADPLALWEPTVEGSRYFAELLRMRRMQDLKDADGTAPGRSPEAMLHEDGALDLFGSSIGEPLYRSAKDRSLAAETDGHRGPILLVQLDRKEALRPEYAELVDRWRQAGRDVRTDSVVGGERWWFPGLAWQGPEASERGAALVEITSDWLRRIA